MKLDLNVLNKYKEEKLLRCQKHPVHPLLIWNYTEKVQYDNLWDEITTMCRGLVTDHDGNIIARPFKKFFNIEEGKHTETDEFEVFEKMDGSLGIVFFYAKEWHLATRGSFTSEQAEVGKQLLKKYFLDYLHPQYTYLFEIIYPTNRIVVNYGEREELVFLDAFNKDGTRAEYDPNDLWSFPFAKTYDFKCYKEIKKLNWKNSEGFIIRFSNGDRCKIKFEDYVELHRKLSNISEKSVWEFICENKTNIKEYLDVVPDEFHKQIEKWFYGLIAKYSSIKTEVQLTFQKLKKPGDVISYRQAYPWQPIEPNVYSRKDFALAVKDHEYKSMLFRVLDNKDIHDDICKLIKPENSNSLIFDKE